MVNLPAPTGPHPVGARLLQLIDSSRADPWVPGLRRELMVTLWYPAKPSDEPRARYLTPAESATLLAFGGITDVPPDLLSQVGTHAIADAEPVADGPLVLLSPGFTKPRATLTSWAEDLASHGYSVAAIEHTHESVATSFPDGRVATCVARESPRGPGFWARATTGRAADVSFVLDELGVTAPVGMAGHSLGGAGTIAAMLTDDRVRAGADVDGATRVEIPGNGFTRPFLFVGRAGQYRPGASGAAATWERDWQRMTGWKRWFLVSGAAHGSFTDIALLAGQPPGATLPAARGGEITRTYLRAFFDLHLRGAPQPLLDEPVFPEVSRVRTHEKGRPPQRTPLA